MTNICQYCKENNSSERICQECKNDLAVIEESFIGDPYIGRDSDNKELAVELLLEGLEQWRVEKNIE